MMMILRVRRRSFILDSLARSFSARGGDFVPKYNKDGARSRSTDQEGRRMPPDPIPNRPLRAERPTHQRKTFNQGRASDGGGTGAIRMDFNKSGNAFNSKVPQQSSQPQAANLDFLEKFKLGFDKGGEKKEPTKMVNNNSNQPTELPQPEDADEIFKKMKETGLIPNAVSMLHGLCQDGLVQEAMKLFSLMHEKGTIPEVIIYTAVIEGFCKAHKLDDAKRIFRKMQGNGILPNAITYGVLIQGLIRKKSLDDALVFSVEMLEAGHSPNLATFTGLVDCFCQEKGLEEAQIVIKTLREKSFLVEDKAVREYLDKKGPFSQLVWEAILGKSF
ncbi:uncharacterized protein LOC141724278 [Apium graveolens]|uniref:uncharacterized protein LOC141724278 n=1 Tax=Apium graveolens TaxID=4045 RepID=UPI003D7A3F1D